MKASIEEGVLSMEGHQGCRDLAAYDRLTRASLLAPIVRRAIVRGRHWLLFRQQPEGHWDEPTEGDASLEAQFVLAAHSLGREDDPRVEMAAARLEQLRLPGGGWSRFPGGPCDANISVLAYFALKLCGREPGEAEMRASRRAIVRHGGVESTGARTRLWLAVLGQVSYDHVAGTTPLGLLLGERIGRRWKRAADWVRAIELPMAVVAARRPVRRIELGRGIGELLTSEPGSWPPTGSLLLAGGPRRRTAASRVVGPLPQRAEGGWPGRVMPPLARLGRGPGKAIRRWFTTRLRWALIRSLQSDRSPGDQCTSLLWNLVALWSLGCEETDPAVARCRQRLRSFVCVEAADGPDGESLLKVRPRRSPVADTAVALGALAETGLPRDHRRVRRAVDWLLRATADQQQAVEGENAALTVSALLQPLETPEAAACGGVNLWEGGADFGGHSDDAVDGVRCQKIATAVERTIAWLLESQNADGGWSAVARQSRCRSRRKAAAGGDAALCDASAADVTGLVVEALGRSGRRLGDPAVDRAVGWLRHDQQADGSWRARWGVGCVYGTWRALSGLIQVGVDRDDPTIAAGVNWLLAHQQPDGGWGQWPDRSGWRGVEERVVDEPPATATQTAWALLGLLAAGLTAHPAVARGIEFLVDAQNAEGTWEDRTSTGVALPGVSYLRRDSHAACFPLMAISRWIATATASLAQTKTPPLRLVSAGPDEPRGSLARGVV